MKSEQLETKANEVCEECKTKLILNCYKWTSYETLEILGEIYSLIPSKCM